MGRSREPCSCSGPSCLAASPLAKNQGDKTDLEKDELWRWDVRKPSS